MTEEMKSFILSYDSKDAGVIAKGATQQFGKFVPTAEVVKLLAEAKRHARMGALKGKVAETLDDKFSVMEVVSSKLLASFNDERLPLKERIEAAKELRQWTRMGIDLSGIHDEASDTLFIIDPEWSPNSRDVN